MGYRTYRLVIRETAHAFPDVESTDTTAENRWFKIAFDEKTGYISSLYKKNAGTAAGPLKYSVPSFFLYKEEI